VFNEGNFAWDGQSNIVILCARNNGSWQGSVSWQTHNPGFLATTYAYSDTNNGYNVEIGWREEGLAQYEVWTMTAHAVTADSLTYTNGKYVIRRFEHQGDTAFVEETVYTDGTGSFALTTNGDLLWTDLKEEPDNRETLFMRAQFSEEEEKETTTN
jgi:hypothetical protein